MERAAAAAAAATMLAATLGGCARTAAPARAARDAPSVNDPAAASIGDLAVKQGGVHGRDAAPASDDLSAALHAHPLTPKLDGAVDEWPELDDITRAESGSSATELSAGIAYDDANLYLAGEVHDGTASPGDAIELDLEFPVSGSERHESLAVHLEGKRGRVTRNGQASGGHAFVQRLDAEGGSTFEAQIPWSELGAGRTVRVGLHAALRYRDFAGDKEVAVLGSGPGSSEGGSPRLSSPLLIAPEENLESEFLAPRGLVGTPPDQDLLGDVAGDALKERILLYGSLLVVLGPHYRHGQAFDWLDLGARVKRLDVRDATGDGKDDLLVLRQVTTGDEVTREAFEILTFTTGAPASVFAHEVRIEHQGREVADFVHAGRGTVDVGAEKAAGWDAASFNVDPAAVIDPILLPWSRPATQSYRYDGTKFVLHAAAPGG